MKKLISIIFLSLFATQCFAELKVGVIDMNQILQKSPLMVSLNNDLLKKFQPRQDELIAAQKALQDDNNKLNINGNTLSAEDRNKLQTKIVNEQANVQILTASLQRDLALAKDQALQKFMAKLSQVINNIARSEHYDYIQQNNTFVFVDTKLDLTQKVLDQVK